MSGPMLIQGAMEVETDWLTAQLERPEKIMLGGYSFWRGSYNGCALVIGRTEIGEVNAACATTLGILHFAPAAVINQGLAGAHKEALHIGDVVVGESCTHINDWQTAIRGRGEGSAPFSWSGSNRQRALPGDPALVSLFGAAPYADGTLTPGRLGSGDLFSREYDRILWLRERCGHLCEDMESIAVYEVCHRLGVPCLGVRIISNNELTGEPYTPAVGELLQKFVLKAVCDKKMLSKQGQTACGEFIFDEVKKIKTITICGSIKFAEQMKQIAWKLESEKGFNVIQCVYDEQNEPVSDEAQSRLATAHYKKIDICDAVYIVDIDGYIGTSVSAEILYAKEKGKELIYHSKQP